MDNAWTIEMAVDVPAGPEPAEASLVGAARRGDADAFEQLVRLHERRVFRLVGRFFRRREDVEEIAQETFLAAWSKLHTYQARAPFEHWLTRICLNCCYARLRKSRGRMESALDEQREPASTHAANPAATVDVERLLSRLVPADRFILLLMHGQGWSVAEIADRLGWSAVNVKVRAHRARKKLRRLLEQGE